ncbi:ABC transporter permease [Lentzea sp. BCCO 10_0856]|uniref:ABC transporter permease n=1 Tax=Lentzea miocenica TaxID=3095431 RepID=A0ABU4SZM5_9PSEU|nr:ABC transporter permease [Lentzea sp. BCCO 10_0856]MDX8031372.1 ABC transporter permease [Lentzea sp. BCCO 10_0856]
MRNTARVLRYAFASAMADLRATYTWKSWGLAWLLRMLFQVTLFAFVGKLIGDPRVVEYLVIGNSVFIIADVVMLVCASTSWERMSGTLPLLVASPAAPFTVFTGRSVQWLLDGLACSTISLLVLPQFLGVQLPLGTRLAVVPLIAVIAVSVYFFGLVLGGLALRAMAARNLIGRVGSIGLMLLTGVQVPVSFWPSPLESLAQLLPLTHGLGAVRAALGNGSASDVLRGIALEIVVGIGWALVAAFTYWRLVESGRRDGTIEFGG